jgi:hypothetical protein
VGALSQRLLITADGGGSNGSRVRLWKNELQKLADELAFPSPCVTAAPHTIRNCDKAITAARHD